MLTNESDTKKERKFDLEERTFRFARDVRNFLAELSPEEITQEDKKQLLRSSGSIGANYIEANEAISPKDFLLRIKICKKESKESFYWIKLIHENIENSIEESLRLQNECLQLVRIFSAIAMKIK